MQWHITSLVICCAIAQIGAQYITKICNVIPNPSLDPLGVGFQDIRGTVTLTQAEEASETIDIFIELTGFDQDDQPTSHGFHVHETGDIESGCEGARGHFNPFNMTHGAPTYTERHVGDLGNIEEFVSGDVVQTKEDSVIKFHGEADITGRAIVIHERYDDFGDGNHPDSNSTGNAGPRLACCVISAGTNAGIALTQVGMVTHAIALLLSFSII